MLYLQIWTTLFYNIGIVMCCNGRLFHSIYFIGWSICYLCPNCHRDQTFAKNMRSKVSFIFLKFHWEVIKYLYSKIFGHIFDHSKFWYYLKYVTLSTMLNKTFFQKEKSSSCKCGFIVFFILSNFGKYQWRINIFNLFGTNRLFFNKVFSEIHYKYYIIYCEKNQSVSH